LPTGAATETTLSALNGKVTACNTGAVTISAALPAGSNSIGNIGTVTTVTTVSAVTAITNALPTGSNVVGRVGIDQTTPGTTDSVTVATGQGAGATIGAVADAAVSAGATGTVSAKLRRVTQGLEDLKTGIVLAAGTNVVGASTAASSATGGAMPYHLRSAASNNATSLKASAGTLYGWHIVNNNTTTCYRVKFYNKATAPSPGSDTPVYVITVPAAASASQPTVV
jgi:hypothetical protein